MRFESLMPAAYRTDAGINPEAVADGTLKVLYVLGFPRSGTTVLGNLLGEIEGLMHVGELAHLWERSLRATGNRCGCGRAVGDCDFWTPVLGAALDDVWPGAALALAGEAAAAEHRSRLLRAAAAQRHAFRAAGVTSALLARFAPRLLRTPPYAQLTQALYHRAAEAVGASVIVDTSKLSKPAVFLCTMPRIDPYFVHIVRDPRGSVLSRQRKRSPLILGRHRLKSKTTIADSIRWMRDNAVAEMLCRILAPHRFMSLTYEQFAAEPESTLRSVLRFIGSAQTALSFLDGSTAVLRSNHTVCGNRNRFQSGQVNLHVDDAWRAVLRNRDKVAIAALTIPGLLRYRYLFDARAGARGGTS